MGTKFPLPRLLRESRLNAMRVDAWHDGEGAA